MGKSIVFTYVLWLIGGWFGLHHFYLRRDRHAFLWFSTLGGCFGMGWLRDFWRIPDYVRDVNEDPQYMELLTLKMRHSPSGPGFSFTRLCGGYIVGLVYGTLFCSFLPEDLVPLTYINPLIPFAVAVGVNLVSSVGREQGSLLWASLGAYAALPWTQLDPSKLGTSALFSAALMQLRGKSWRRTTRRSHWCKRLFLLGVCCSLFSTLCFSTLYFNSYVHNKNGEKVRLRDAVKHFFNSPAWTETKQAIWDMYNTYQAHGWEKMYEEFATKLDPEGEGYAHKVLGVDADASEEEITKAYRSLVKQWHPDKVKDPDQKEAAAEKFMQIQKAYETLSNIRSRTSNKSSRHR